MTARHKCEHRGARQIQDARDNLMTVCEDCGETLAISSGGRKLMTPNEFTAALETLGETPTSFAKLVGSNDKNMRRAAEPDSDGPGPAASFALRLMLALDAIVCIRRNTPKPAGRQNLAGDEFEGAFIDAEIIAEKALRGEFE